MSKANILLDATMLDMFQLCETRFNYRFNHNKVTIIKAEPLDKGTLVHLGLESYYNGIKTNQPYSIRLTTMEETVRAAGIESDLDVETVSNILAVLRNNVEYWKAADERLEILEVEQPFSYVLHEDDDLRIIMTGKIDLLVNDHPHYQSIPYDHKSYSRDYPARRLTNQFQNYAYACSSNYLFVNKIGFQTSLKSDQKFKRVPLSYDPMILSQWKDNVVKTVNRYINCVATNSYEMNLTSCDKYNRQCEYYEVCDSSGQEAKLYKLNSNFNTAEPWDVSAVLKGKEE